ncbi:MAG: histidine kinase [Actinomycetaceae bacterium]|nr:histidine kinase [Actinomycetaceae bacterium]
MGMYRAHAKIFPIASTTGKKTSAMHKVVFCASAVLIVLVELLDDVDRSFALSAPESLALCLLGVLLAAGAFFPVASGLLYIALLVWTSVFGDIFAFPILGLYLIVGAWILSSRTILAIIVLALTETIWIVLSPVHVSQAVSALVGSGITLAVSFMLRLWKMKNAQAASEAQQAREQAAQASMTVRRQLAQELHDTIAKDLARIALMAQEFKAAGSVSADELGALADMAAAASRRIRPTIMDLDRASYRESASQTISLVVKMLSTRAIELDVSAAADMDELFEREQILVLTTVIREGATNILKYAPAGSQASLTCGIDEKGSAITVSMGNDIADEINTDVTGGFGLANLEQQVASVGGELSYGSFEKRWILYATIPLSEKEGAENE